MDRGPPRTSTGMLPLSPRYWVARGCLCCLTSDPHERLGVWRQRSESLWKGLLTLSEEWLSFPETKPPTNGPTLFSNKYVALGPAPFSALS